MQEAAHITAAGDLRRAAHPVMVRHGQRTEGCEAQNRSPPTGRVRLRRRRPNRSWRSRRAVPICSRPLANSLLDQKHSHQVQRSVETTRRAKERGGAARPMAGLETGRPSPRAAIPSAVGGALSVTTCMPPLDPIAYTRSRCFPSRSLAGSRRGGRRLTAPFLGQILLFLPGRHLSGSDISQMWMQNFSDTDDKFWSYTS